LIEEKFIEIDTSEKKEITQNQEKEKISEESKIQPQNQTQKESPKISNKITSSSPSSQKEPIKTHNIIGRIEKKVSMNKMRQTIAARLKSSQNENATLTTFNECDMGEAMSLRSKYQDQFVKKHGIKLGLMSFFLKASTIALQEMPVFNSVIEQNSQIIQRNYIDISVAVSSPNGLLVPVIRNCSSLNFAEFEQKLSDLGKKARNGKITIEDMQGGNFTISNGGVYGSLFGTPIINPPQTSILGMHNIVNRPVVYKGEITTRPIMYLALSYDHRLVDGREAVSFLGRIKELVESPEKMLIEI